MAYRLPNGSTFDVAATYDAEITITAISNANPAVVTAAGHGLVDEDIVYLQVGWTKATNRAFRVIDADTDTFKLEGLDTTNITQFPVGGGVGTAKSVSSWIQIPQIMTVDFAGGEQNFYTWQFLEDDDERQLPTSKSATSLTINVADDPEQPYVPIIEGYDVDKSTNVFRLNLVNGDSILYPAVSTITATPTLTPNELMQRTISLAMQGRISRYNEV